LTIFSLRLRGRRKRGRRRRRKKGRGKGRRMRMRKKRSAAVLSQSAYTERPIPPLVEETLLPTGIWVGTQLRKRSREERGCMD
jgi:hypothetical protein